MLNTYFIVYDSRSGSTMLSSLLSKWMKTYVIPESQLPIEIMIAFGESHTLTQEDCELIQGMIEDDRKIDDWRVTNQLLEIAANNAGNNVNVVIREFYDAFLGAQQNKTNSLGIKKESYLIVADRIKTIYPSAKFLCMIRDPRGIFSSKKNSINTGTGKTFENEPIRSGFMWKEYIRRIEHLRLVFPEDVYFVKYEEVLRDEERAMRDLASFIGMEVSLSETNFVIHERYSKIHSNVGKSLIGDNDKKWMKKLSKSEIKLLEIICAKEMKNFGYDQISSMSLPKKTMMKLYATFRLFTISFIFFIRSKFGTVIYDRGNNFVLGKRDTVINRLYRLLIRD